MPKYIVTVMKQAHFNVEAPDLKNASEYAKVMKQNDELLVSVIPRREYAVEPSGSLEESNV